MTIEIMSHREVVSAVLKDRDRRHNIIFITNPGNHFAIEGTCFLPDLAASFLMLVFHDANRESREATCPTRDHIEQALAFADGKDNLIVCCHAGVSRSAATAYVIQSKRTDPVSALNILDFSRHMPNTLVVKQGADLLEKPDMESLIARWRDQATGEGDFLRTGSVEVMKRMHGVR